MNGPRAWDLDLALDVTFTDLDVNYRVTLRNGVLISRRQSADDTATASLTLTKLRMLALLGGDLASPGVEIGGDPAVLQSLLGVLEPGNPAFNIVEP